MSAAKRGRITFSGTEQAAATAAGITIWIPAEIAPFTVAVREGRPSQTGVYITSIAAGCNNQDGSVGTIGRVATIDSARTSAGAGAFEGGIFTKIAGNRPDGFSGLYHKRFAHLCAVATRVKEDIGNTSATGARCSDLY